MTVVERCAARSRTEASPSLVMQVAQELFQARRALSRPAECIQDASWAWMVSSDLLAITRLARPNRLNNCAVFLAKPL
jgi:hypothetical protein